MVLPTNLLSFFNEYPRQYYSVIFHAFYLQSGKLHRPLLQTCDAQAAALSDNKGQNDALKRFKKYCGDHSFWKYSYIV